MEASVFATGEECGSIDPRDAKKMLKVTLEL
jgi:hypothetical protein